ncbi:MAG: substrate-binding domain-containing protein [Chloroflexota bacterium]
MQKVQSLRAFDQIKQLADPRRLQILRLLMAEPATLSHLARVLGQSPAWVRHHILALESADLIELSEIRRTGTIIEKFYRARAGALLLQELVLPKSEKPVVIFSGSHDLALEAAAAHLERHALLLTLPVGSLDGLVNLRQGLCQFSGAHLLDESGEYNTPYVRRIFPDRDMELVTLAHRTQGWIVAPGNPKGVRSASDLARAGLRFINRNPGSGTRLWLDAELKRLGVPVEQVDGYFQIAFTHNDTACAVAEGRADVALGLQAAAQKYNLDFIPLFNERYDLVFPRELSRQLSILLNYIQSAGFRRDMAGLNGYECAHTGEQIQLH